MWEHAVGLFESGPVDESRGVAFNLFNNMWMCNYVLWYPFDEAVADLKSRFTLRLRSPQGDDDEC